jgi:hypothetical protein
MNIEIVGIRNADELERERIVLRAVGDTDIGDYLVIRVHTKDDAVRAGRMLDCYWFRDKLVQAGDLIVLYSKAGSAREKRNDDESTTHFFYWGLSQACWSEPNSAAVLMRLREWESHFPEHVTSRKTASR